MNLRDLEYVVAIAEEGHFGRAAERCHVSQPALSGQIRKLEEFLGVDLFERSNRQVLITSVGQDIVRHARQTIALADDIVDIARAARDPFQGEISIGLISTIAPYLSPLVLPTIRRALPDLTLTLSEGLTTDLEAKISNGDLDCAITATDPEHKNLSETLLYTEPFRVGVCKDHSLAQQGSIDLTEIDPQDLLLLSDGHCLRNQVIDVCHLTTGASNLNTRNTSMETLLALVAAENRVTLVPALTAEYLNRTHREIIAKPETTGTAGRTVRLIYRSSFPRKTVIDRLADLICQNVPGDVVHVADRADLLPSPPSIQQ